MNALAFAPDLKHMDRKVGAAFLAHFSRWDGRCDPGLDRLCWLLDVDRRTVMRAIERLVSAGYFDSDRHGGRHGTNSYEPIWSRFEEVLAWWNDRFALHARTREAKESARTGQFCPAPGGSAAPQTSSSNQLKRTKSGSKRSSRSRSTAPASAEVARQAAERRRSNDLNDAFRSSPDAYAAVISAVDEHLQVTATDTEVRARGTGLKVILDGLRKKGLDPRSNPSATSGPGAGDDESGPARPPTARSAPLSSETARPRGAATDGDPLDIPPFLRRGDPACFVNRESRGRR